MWGLEEVFGEGIFWRRSSARGLLRPLCARWFRDDSGFRLLKHWFILEKGWSGGRVSDCSCFVNGDALSGQW